MNPGLISVVIPVYNEEECLPILKERLEKVLSAMEIPWEIVLVNDGSRDRTGEILDRFHDEDERFRIIHLSRNFGHQMALTAGLDHAAGDAVISMDADLQDPPECLHEMIARWKGGDQIVYARRLSRERSYNVLKARVASLFYRMLSAISDIPIPPDTGDFRLMDRRVIDVLRRVRERHRYIRGLSVWAGYRQSEVVYERAERRAGQSKYSLSKLALLGLDGVISFSVVPLRLAALLGLGSTLVAFLLAAWSVWRRFCQPYPDFAIGWASLFIVVLLMGGVQLLVLGIFGEYIGRIYEESKGRPLYLIAETRGIRASSPEKI